MSFKVISTNEYQDCIRITDGFLLVVNKFYTDDRIDCNKYYKIPKNYYKKLNKGVKDNLWVLTRPIEYYHNEVNKKDVNSNSKGVFPIGTVFYEGKPIYRSDNPDYWNCYTRTAWGMNHGDLDYWIDVSNCIQNILKKYKDNYMNELSKKIKT